MAGAAIAKLQPSFRFKVPGVVKESFTDLAAYPILTEEVGYPPSPLATPGTGAPPMGAGTSPIGQIAAKAVSDVLGWRVKPGDNKGFIGALTQSFSLKDTEGHVEATWTPRTYAVQTDLAGGISGAQASIYARAQEAADQFLPKMDAIYALDVDADPADITALKAVIRTQVQELVNELGLAGGPRVSRVEQIFSLLLDPPFPHVPPTPPLSLGQIETEPDYVGGQLGALRDLMGLWSVVIANPSLVTEKTLLINTVEQEQNVTNYRIMVDYLTSLRQSWNNNQQFFGLRTTTPFFGTQLVVISRQLSVVSDAVDEVRFTMDSVFITPSERQTLEIDFPSFVPLAKHPPVRPANIPGTGSSGAPAGSVNDNVIDASPQGPQPMFAEDILSWIQRFSSEEAQALVQEGGKFAVGNTVLPTTVKLRNLVLGAIQPTNSGDLPRGYHTPRVRRALQDLASQLDELAFLCNPLSYTMPPKE